MAEFGIKLVIMANPQGAKIIRDFAAIFPVAFFGEVLPGVSRRDEGRGK